MLFNSRTMKTTFTPYEKLLIAKYNPDVILDFRKKELKQYDAKMKNDYIKKVLKSVNDIKKNEPIVKITRSERQLLKDYNKEALPDFRSKEWQILTSDEKEEYLREQIQIAIENKKESKEKINYIGDIKFTFITYTLTEKEIAEIDNDDSTLVSDIINFEEKRNNIWDLYFEDNKRIEEIKFSLGTDKNIKSDFTNIKKTSYKDGYDNRFYFSNDIIINFDIKINKNDFNDYIKAFIIKGTGIMKDGYNNDNDYDFINKDYKINYNINNKKVNEYKKLKMKDASVYNLEDYENQEWDTKNGRCVFDYIINRYGNIKGFKLACNDENLLEVFDDEDALINGVDTYQLNNFCEKYKIPLYAYNENDDLFHFYYPDKKSNVPSMMFKILNNHFYPIPETKRKAYINKKTGLNIYSNLYQEQETKQKETKEEIINLNKNENSLIKLGEMMNDNKKIPLVKMYNGKITTIKLNNNKYLFNDNDEQIKQITLNMGLDYTGQSIGELVSIIIKEKINSSNPNIYVYNQLLKAKKNRSFNGLISKKIIDYKPINYYKINKKINNNNNQIDELNELNNEINEILKLDFIKENVYYNDNLKADYKPINYYKINKHNQLIIDELNNEIYEILKLDFIKEKEYYNDNLKTDYYKNIYNEFASLIKSNYYKINNNNQLKIDELNNEINEILKLDFIKENQYYKCNIYANNYNYINYFTPNKIINNQLIIEELNNEINEILKLDFIKEKEYYNDNLIAYDINKCYSSILYNPIEEWMLIDVNNDWEDWEDKNEIKLGLYYIITDDNLLFKGNNIYSSSIVKKAIQENINFTISKVLYADKKQSKELFIDIIDEILKITNNDKDLYKLMINHISGMLGRNKTTHTKGQINKSIEQIFITLDNYKKIDKEINPFITKINNTDYYLYGYNKDVKLYENNIPMYIQILDQSNIKLYDMIKKADGELIGRKVDCAIIKNPKNKLELGEKWGDYRLSSIPKLTNKEINNNFNFIEELEYKEYRTLNDSDNYQKILNICLTYGGCLMTGDAGTGKSYVIKKITEILGKEKVIKITPTNKSALNIRGQTIHRFLQLKDGKISRNTIEKIKNMNLDLIIIDEISMINKDLWKLLLLLKEETKIKFLLVGDDKQLPPIEDDGIERDYFNSSIVKYLSNYNKINLTIKKRYDKKLSDILDNIDYINIKDFNNSKETQKNICYLNKTRKLINAYWNNKLKLSNSILIKEDKNDEYSQDIYLYKNLPLIAKKTVLNGDLIINNEKFILENYDNEFLYLSSERPDENGETIIHKIDININDLQKYFCLNYCSTTHKSQGDTIIENFTIYDFNLMSKKCKYTALSRAKNTEQITIKQ